MTEPLTQAELLRAPGRPRAFRWTRGLLRDIARLTIVSLALALEHRGQR